jgi:RNA polymerase sigma-70 factor (ECF subfamily)
MNAENDLTTEALWGRFARDLTAYFRRRIPGSSDVDDLLQETFVRLHAGLPRLRSRDRVSVWLYRIARSVLEDHRRANARTAVLEDEDAIPDERHETDATLNREVGSWARAFLEFLPETYRTAVKLADVDGLPQAEIARRLDLSLSGAKSRVQRGRALLKAAVLDCCHVALDRHGNVLETRPREQCACLASVGEGGLITLDPSKKRPAPARASSRG